MAVARNLPIAAWHRVDREWEGETAFIVGGGPSVLKQNIELLRGRKVIAINSSYERVPFADYLVYNDSDWWREHKTKVDGFAGWIVTPAGQPSRCTRRLFLRKRSPPLASDPSALAMRRTTFTAAINLAVHLGVNKIVLLGADGRMGVDQNGKPLSHHHKPHAWWKFKNERWGLHRDELKTLVQPLSDLGIETINASPESAWDMWPVVRLEDCL